MGEPVINPFLPSLAVEETVSASTRNQALFALHSFFSRHVLSRDLRPSGDANRPRKPKRLTAVMTGDYVKSPLAHLTGDKWLTDLSMYGAT